MQIIGLDVSTSCIGVCVLDTQASVGQTIVLDKILFKKCRTLWDKADVVVSFLSVLKRSLEKQGVIIGRVFIEEPLMGFRQGKSSAQTITSLMRFNGVVSYLTRQVFGVDPEYIGSAHARKLCGIKLLRTALGGPQKEQVFSHMMKNDLKAVVWPKTKKGKDVPWSRDACDAYVIARAAVVSSCV